MAGQVIGIQMGFGYPGSYARGGDCYIHNRPVKAATPDVEFGMPVVVNADGTYQKFGAANTAAQFAGVAVREVKQSTDFYAAAGVYKAGEPMDVMERGNVSVKCLEGTPAPGTKVYVVTVEGTNVAVGDLCATATPAGAGATAIELTNCRWVGTSVDSNKVTELAIVSRNNG